MKRILRCLLCAMAAWMLLLSLAQAAPRYPAFQGSVTDAAAVLSGETVSQLKSVMEDIREETDLNLTVVTVDFLDGYPIDQYASGLRGQWELFSNNMLVLLAVGEDRCTVDVGGDGGDVLIPLSTLQKLANMHLVPAMLREDYNGAMHEFIPSLLTELNKVFGTRLSADYFGMPPAAAEPKLPGEWLEQWTDHFRTAQEYSGDHYTAEENEDDEISLGKIILTLILLSVVFGKDKRRRRAGCGCSPISRILAMFGLWRLWDRD